MAQEITMDSILESRNATYSMLARLYRKEMDSEYFKKMRGMRFPINTGNADVDKGYRLLHSYLNSSWERTMEDLERDYVRVFIGANTTGHSAAYPNESVHTSPDRLVMQDARDEVMYIYHAAGLKNSELWKSGEDHIATELEYEQVIGERAAEAWAKGDRTSCATNLLMQYHFLEDHLLNWVQFLTADVLKFAQTDFYRGVAYLTQGFLLEDKEFLEEVLAEELEMERELTAARARGEEEESAEASDPVEELAEG